MNRRQDDIDIYEELYPNIRRRNYSPDNKEAVTQRIIKYFEDPKESSALAEIKKLSNQAKEKGRVMFKGVGDDNTDEKNNAPFLRRRKQFGTQKYVAKNKNMSLMDELKLKMNEKNKQNAKKEEKKKEDEKKIFGGKEKNYVEKKEVNQNENKYQGRRSNYKDTKEKDEKKKY